MSRAKKVIDFSECYENFQTPYTGIATMILVQAVSDLSYLGNAESIRKDGYLICKWEIVDFLLSPWAALLAEGAGIDPDDLREYVERAV